MYNFSSFKSLWPDLTILKKKKNFRTKTYMSSGSGCGFMFYHLEGPEIKLKNNSGKKKQKTKLQAQAFEKSICSVSGLIEVVRRGEQGSSQPGRSQICSVQQKSDAAARWQGRRALVGGSQRPLCFVGEPPSAFFFSQFEAFTF